MRVRVRSFASMALLLVCATVVLSCIVSAAASEEEHQLSAVPGHAYGSSMGMDGVLSPRTISRRVHRLNAFRVNSLDSDAKPKKVAVKATKKAAKPSTKSKATATSKSAKSTATGTSTPHATSPVHATQGTASSLTHSRDELFGNFIVAFRKGYKDLATAKAKQATLKANAAKIDELNKRARNGEPSVAKLIQNGVQTPVSGAAVKATKSTNKVRFADVDMELFGSPKKAKAASSKSKSTSSSKKKAIDATAAERNAAKSKFKSAARQAKRKTGRVVFGVNRFSDLTAAEFKAKYANSQSAAAIVSTVKANSQKKAEKLKNKKIPLRHGGVTKKTAKKTATKATTAKKPSASANKKKRSFIQIDTHAAGRAAPPAKTTTTTSKANVGGVTAAAFGNSNVAGGPTKPQPKPSTSSTNTGGVTSAAFGNSNVGGGPSKPQSSTSSTNTGGVSSAGFGNSNVGGGPDKSPPKTSSTSTSGTNSAGFANSNVAGGPDGDDAANQAVSPSAQWSAEELEQFAAGARITPTVPYKTFGSFVDKLVDWSGVIPIVRATAGCGACWAVTTADATAAAYFRAFGKPIKQVSSMAIMDCNFNDYNGGCKGGSLANAVNSIIDTSVARKVNGGEVYFESDYPYRYNTNADAMIQQCKPQSGTPLPLISTWSWAIPPFKSPVVDMSGYMAAVQNQQIGNQKAAATKAAADQLSQQANALTTQASDAFSKAMADRQKQVEQLWSNRDAAVNALNDQVDAQDALCRQKSTYATTTVPPQNDAKLKAADATRLAARDAFYAYQASDPYSGVNRKDQAKFDQFKAAFDQATAKYEATSKQNQADYRAAMDDTDQCRKTLSAMVNKNNAQRDVIRQQCAAEVAKLPTEADLKQKYLQSSIDQTASASANVNSVLNQFQMMTPAELMDAFSGYPSLSYGWYTNPEYVEVMSLPGDANAKREILLARALNKYGPLAVIIDAAQLNSYAGGVLQATDMMCSSDPTAGNHAIMLTGLAVDPTNNQQYWILKNSWGTDWGNGGYLYLARGQNVCGISNAAAKIDIKGDTADPVSMRQDAQITAYLNGEPSTYAPRQ